MTKYESGFLYTEINNTLSDHVGHALTFYQVLVIFFQLLAEGHVFFLRRQ